jgi:glycosyltransferase involved in cell wall biosynthesis
MGGIFMHICLVSTYFPQPCGIANYTHNLANALLTIDQNLSLTILAGGDRKPLLTKQFNVLDTFAWDNDYPADIMARVKTLRPDIVHIQHEYGIFGLDDRFHRLLAHLREKEVPSVVTLHTVHTLQGFYGGCARPYLRMLLKRVNIEKYQWKIGSLADLVVVHQEVPIRNVLLRQGMAPNRVMTIPHGTHLAKPPDKAETKTVLGVSPGNPLIMAFGYFESSKNMHLLIEAFHRVKKRIPGARLWIGAYVRHSNPQTLAYRERCLRLIKKFNLENYICIEDRMIPEREVKRVLGAADIVCMVYKEDTRSSSGVLHLAMGLGKAVVASRIPKFHELSEVADELLVSPWSVRELSSILERLILDHSFRNAIEKGIRDYALQTTWPAVAETHLAAYRRLLETQLKNYTFPTAIEVA